MGKWFDKLVGKQSKHNENTLPYLRALATGTYLRMSDLKKDTDIHTIQAQIETMRALASDSQISTALSYYATDATTANSDGNIIWATPIDKHNQEVADIINALFAKWRVNLYARDHILELATVGNLYIPTTHLFRTSANLRTSENGIALDVNTIAEENFQIVPAYSLPPEEVVHLWYQGNPYGFIYQPEDDLSSNLTGAVRYPETSIIHFSLGGLLGRYSLNSRDSQGNDISYDIQFAQPLMERAVQPTQTLSLLEDSLLLSSLNRVIKFLNVDCGAADDDEIAATLQQIKDTIEQQLSLNTANGDAQSFINPQSPNNLIYLPKINGQDAISVTDLNMTEATEADNKLLQYYQDKKLSVLGVPKEAMNFSSSEGLGGAGAVMSQRSALYANILLRLETAYINGWTDAINKYFIAHNLSGYVGKYTLHMNPIMTEMSALQSDKRDSAINQATTIVDLMKSLGITQADRYREALVEILQESLPHTGSSASSWSIDLEGGNNEPEAF